MNKREWKARRWAERARKRWLRRCSQAMCGYLDTPDRQWFTLSPSPPGPVMYAPDGKGKLSRRPIFAAPAAMIREFHVETRRMLDDVSAYGTGVLRVLDHLDGSPVEVVEDGDVE